MSHKFKDYNQQQNWLLPPCIEEMIPPDHPVRIVNGMIEHLFIGENINFMWLSNKQVANHNTIAPSIGRKTVWGAQ